MTACEAVPKAGAVVGVAKAKVPGTEAAPPLSVEEARVWPMMIAEAVGGVVTVGVALEMTRVPLAVPT